jgi:hypothetical protein
VVSGSTIPTDGHQTRADGSPPTGECSTSSHLPDLAERRITHEPSPRQSGKSRGSRRSCLGRCKERRPSWTTAILQGPPKFLVAAGRGRERDRGQRGTPGDNRLPQPDHARPFRFEPLLTEYWHDPDSPVRGERVSRLARRPHSLRASRSGPSRPIPSASRSSP